MAIVPKDMVDHAVQMLIAQKAPTELLCRLVCNRAYYGAFLMARDAANIRNSGGSVHQEVLKYYERQNKTVFNQLSSLKKYRQRADYDIGVVVSQRDANASCRQAESVIKTLSGG